MEPPTPRGTCTAGLQQSCIGKQLRATKWTFKRMGVTLSWDSGATRVKWYFSCTLAAGRKKILSFSASTAARALHVIAELGAGVLHRQLKNPSPTTVISRCGVAGHSSQRARTDVETHTSHLCLLSRP
eukprot:3671443-Amphidinium_carterae.1